MFSRQLVASLILVGKKFMSVIFSVALIALILLIVLAACGTGAVYSNVVNSL